jgi:hypothetical protein
MEILNFLYLYCMVPGNIIYYTGTEACFWPLLGFDTGRYYFLLENWVQMEGGNQAPSAL